MASLKKLGGQTMWYGLSSMVGRFINYLLTPYLTLVLSQAVYGEITLLYAVIPFLNVIFTYGLETTYFRYGMREGYDEGNVYSTASLSLIASTSLLTAALIFFRQPVADLLLVPLHPEFITWMAGIIALDTLTALPYAKLRHQGRPRKYAFVRIAGIIINIALTVFFYSGLPYIAANYPDSMFASWYNPDMGAGYLVLANLVQSAITLVLLAPEFFSFKLKFDKKLWRSMMLYTMPLIIVGFGGMINEVIDRLLLSKLLTGSDEYIKSQVGIYGACYKLSIVITLFIQAFRLGAEPFFFKQAESKNAPQTYARVMKFFAITVCTMFLAVVLFIDIWKFFIAPKMWEGLHIVPILLLANMCLGIYYNLSIWYKLSQKTTSGAVITFIGVAITLALNIIFIPLYGYTASAWATLACYGSMMVISYLWGQKVYPVPYDIKSIGKYFGAMLLCYFIFAGADYAFMHGVVWMRIIAATILTGGYVLFLLKQEKEEFGRLPVVGRYLR